MLFSDTTDFFFIVTGIKDKAFPRCMLNLLEVVLHMTSIFLKLNWNSSDTEAAMNFLCYKLHYALLLGIHKSIPYNSSFCFVKVQTGVRESISYFTKAQPRTTLF